jgi:hypothetical protein
MVSRFFHYINISIGEKLASSVQFQPFLFLLDAPNGESPTSQLRNQKRTLVSVCSARCYCPSLTEIGTVSTKFKKTAIWKILTNWDPPKFRMHSFLRTGIYGFIYATAKIFSKKEFYDTISPLLSAFSFPYIWVLMRSKLIYDAWLWTGVLILRNKTWNIYAYLSFLIRAFDYFRLPLTLLCKWVRFCCIKLHENPFSGSRVVTCGQTDRQEKTKRRFFFCSFLLQTSLKADKRTPWKQVIQLLLQYLAAA